MKTELTIVIPITTQLKFIGENLKLLGQSLIKASISAEVVIVSSEDGFHLANEEYSRISSASLLKIRAVTLVTKDGRKGLGRLLRLGNSLAESKYVFFMIPEGKFDPDFLPMALKSCRSGQSLVIANRFNNWNKAKVGWRIHVLQQSFLRYTFAILGVSLPLDGTNSSRMFEKHVFDALAISGNGWDMLAEQTIKTVLVGEKLALIDVNIPEFISPGDFRISMIDRFFGFLRLTIRTSFHRVGLPWF